MTARPCPDCGNLVSESAAACPRCGRESALKSKRGCGDIILLIFLIVGGIVAFGMAATCAGLGQ